jgi:cell division protein FtsN
MSRDYKDTSKKSRGPKGGGAPLLIGILIGLLLGLTLALVIAWYINKLPNPFLNRSGAPEKIEPTKSIAGDLPKSEAAKAAEAKPRFDFYKILPGAEEPATDQQFSEAQKKSTTTPANEAFFLQVGAFQNELEADNLKARLALLGLETTIQTTTLPDKAVWHRVRVGPYRAIDDLNRARDTLKQNGIETTLIRVRDAAPPQ